MNSRARKTTLVLLPLLIALAILLQPACGNGAIQEVAPTIPGATSLPTQTAPPPAQTEYPATTPETETPAAKPASETPAAKPTAATPATRAAAVRPPPDTEPTPTALSEIKGPPGEARLEEPGTDRRATSLGTSAEHGTENRHTAGEADTSEGRSKGKPGSRRRHPLPEPPALKAGEIDDNKTWREYLDFLDRYQGPGVHRTNVSERYTVTVRDQRGRPVPNAMVTISANGREVFRARTYADGRTLFFPRGQEEDRNVNTYIVSVQEQGYRRTREFTRNEDSNWELTLHTGPPREQRTPLDVLFLLDSTGSMSDEIDKIKETLLSIARQVSDLPSNPELRFGLVSYRDREDLYVTRLYDFDSNVRRFSHTIRRVTADGGGDYPESLNEALHAAVNQPGWRSDRGVRLIFLLADAPPHLDYDQDHDYAKEMVQARRRGIKIFAVASSGLDAQGEYVMRQIAQQTMGRFIFILYETGPQGELETPHDVGDFTINRLDSLIVRLIQEELGELGRRTGGKE